MSNFTARIRDQDHQIDQKKSIPLITSDVDPYLTLPLVYEGSHLIRLASGQHARLSRHTAKPLNICRVEANKDVRKNFFTVRAVVLWNNLPHVIQAEEDLKEFKRLLDWHHSIVGSFD